MKENTASTEHVVSAKNLDHLGLIASIFRRLKLIERIDQLLPHKDPRRRLSAGEAVLALVLNGLGFTARRLYLAPQFFKNKPLSTLFGRDIDADDINDHVLGRVLDEIYDYGVTQWFMNLSVPLGIEEQLISKSLHLDSTSIAVEGAYEKVAATEDDFRPIALVHGFSKDKRPDLKQFIINMVVSGAAGYPIACDPQDGNASDKKTFLQTQQNLSKILQQLTSIEDFVWIMDAAFYSKENLQLMQDTLWVSRMPESIKEAKELISLQELTWEESYEGYSWATFPSTYGDVKQRLLLIRSEAAFHREKEAFYTNLNRLEAKHLKEIVALSKKEFDCQADAKKACESFMPSKCFQVIWEIVPVSRYNQVGRPAKNTTPEKTAYQITGTLNRKEAVIKKEEDSLGRFILATNQCDESAMPVSQVLKSYKQQQAVEGGFRFIKDSSFLVDSVFLKSNKRIEALSAIMCLCLLIYSVGQHWIRKTLKDTNTTISDQKKKPTQKPTLRWIFMCFDGAIQLQESFNAESTSQYKTKRMVLNVNLFHKKIATIIGHIALEIYGFA